MAVPGHSSTKLTYADYVLFPDDGLRHEIIGGEHVVTPSPVTRHQRILLNLAYLVRDYLETHPIGEILPGPVDVLLSDTDILVPDLVYVAHDRSHVITLKNLQGAPDLVVEIHSPSTKSRDRRLKRDLCGSTTFSPEPVLARSPDRTRRWPSRTTAREEAFVNCFRRPPQKSTVTLNLANRPF